jgi:hypothetical protein
MRTLLVAWFTLNAVTIFLTLQGGFGLAGSQSQASGSPDNVQLASGTYQDFSAHLQFVREYWKGVALRPYTEQGQREIATAWIGQEPARGLAFAYSPTLFLLLAPFTLVGVPAAYLLYGLLVQVATAILLVRFLRPVCGDLRLAWLYVVSTGLSLAWFNTLKFGQTSILTTLAFVWLWTALWDPVDRKWRAPKISTQWWLGLVVGALSAKPNLAVTAGVLLLAGGAWTSVCVAGGVVLLAVVSATLHLGGVQWMSDYLNLLGHYNRDEIGEFLAWSLDVKNNTNFLSATAQLLHVSEAVLSRISSFLWIGGLAVWWVFARREGGSRAAYWTGFHLLWFLLVSPNLMHTEDVLLVLLPVFGAAAFASEQAWLAVGLGFLAANSNQLYGVWKGTVLAELPVPFLAKLGLLVWWFTAPRLEPSQNQ